jgi:hypothetical protein
MATKPKTSTAVTVKKSSSANIVSIQEALKAQAAAMGDRTAPAGGNAIRVTQDKQFLLPDGTKTPGPLELVIVDFTAKNAYYEGAFDPKNITPPACFSIGSNPLKMVPSKNSPLIQAADCQSCRMNEFGSDGNGKACKNARMLAVLPPDADENTPMWILATSPTANKGFDGFVTSVARVFQTPPVGVIATVGFDANETYAKLVFSNPQPNSQLAVHFARQDEAAAMLAVEPDVSKFVKTPPARGVKHSNARR